MKSLLTLFFSVVAASSFAIGNYNVNDELYVHAPSGLKLRNVPDGDNVLATVSFGTKLKVLEARKATGTAKVVDGLSGYWAKVSFDGKTGYIFDGYLSFLPTPKEDCKSLEAYCLANFTKDTEKLVSAFDDADSDGFGETTIQLFKFKGRSVIYSQVHGYEWGEENLTISGISLEEGYLVAKYILRKELADAANFYKTSQTTPNFNPAVFSTYLLRTDGTFFAPYNTDGCSENISIGRRAKEDIVCIKFWGGC